MWTAYRCPDGYGHMSWAGRRSRAHRISWEIANGAVADGMHVLHRCDNPACVNPAHLFLGSNADNVADREQKKRGVVQRKTHKLNEASARAIRSSMEPTRVLAERYGVHRTMVQGIRSGKMWQAGQAAKQGGEGRA